MRRIMLLVAVVVMSVTLAMPALADKPIHPGDCTFDKGKTYCTEKEAIGNGTQFVSSSSYQTYCGFFTGWRTVYVTTYRPYTDYQITDTTYAGKGPKVVDQTTRVEREFGQSYNSYSGGC